MVSHSLMCHPTWINAPHLYPFSNLLFHYCVCVHSAWKGRLQNDLYCVGWDVKPYSLTPTFIPAKQASTRFTYPRGMQGWVDLGIGNPRWFTCPQTVTHSASNHLTGSRTHNILQLCYQDIRYVTSSDDSIYRKYRKISFSISIYRIVSYRRKQYQIFRHIAIFSWYFW